MVQAVSRGLRELLMDLLHLLFGHSRSEFFNQRELGIVLRLDLLLVMLHVLSHLGLHECHDVFELRCT